MAYQTFPFPHGFTDTARTDHAWATRSPRQLPAIALGPLRLPNAWLGQVLNNAAQLNPWYVRTSKAKVDQVSAPSCHQLASPLTGRTSQPMPYQKELPCQ
jgi:hypothetical protein